MNIIKKNIEEGKMELKMINKLYEDRDWLNNQYILLKKSIPEIRNICGGGDIYYWLKKYGISIRSHSEAGSGENNPMYGKHHTDDAKKKMSDAQLGENNHFYGKHHSEESKKKMSKAIKGIYIGEKAPNYGREFSKEWKKNISKALTGKNNPNYGKFGIKAPNWKGGVALYTVIHDWINEHFIKPKLCEICGLPEYYDEKHNIMQWSNKSGKLIKDRSNWQYVHIGCHKRYDIKNDISHEGLN